MKKCPRCDAIALAFGKDHCDSPMCDWFTCIHCNTTYHRKTPTGFLDHGNTTWHSSTEAT